MSNFPTLENKTHDVLRPFSTNPLYQVPIHLIWKSSGPGRKKVFDTLWEGYKYRRHHYLKPKKDLWEDDQADDEVTLKEKVRQIAKRILQGERTFEV